MNTAFFAIEGLDGVHVGQRGKLSCAVVRLNNDDLCLYSPISGMAQAAKDDLAQLGRMSALLAPNHYHNKGLQEHVDLFPRATLICSDAATPRLKNVTGLDFTGLDALKKLLPDNIQILEPMGLKTGEFWLQITNECDVAWIVTDAFSAPQHKPGSYAEAPKLLGSFPKYGIKDSVAFKSWVTDQLSRQAPTILLPCHGSPVRNPDLGAALRRLLDAA